MHDQHAISHANARKRRVRLMRGNEMFAIIIIAKEARHSDGSIATKDGEKFVLERGEWGPSTKRYYDNKSIGADTLVFKTEQEAITQAEQFKMHPWWVVKKEHRIIEIKPRYRQVLDGYDIA